MSTPTPPTLPVRIWRGDAGGRFERYDVPRHASQTVLDVVSHVQQHVDCIERLGRFGVAGRLRWIDRGSSNVHAATGPDTLDGSPQKKRQAPRSSIWRGVPPALRRLVMFTVVVEGAGTA